MADLYYPFCLVDLTKKFIVGILFLTSFRLEWIHRWCSQFQDQGDGLIPNKPEYAFAFASLILALWVEFENFGDLLLGNFMKKCPYTIPAYWPQLSDQTDKEYYLWVIFSCKLSCTTSDTNRGRLIRRKLGYRYNDDGVVEDWTSFLKRMTGILMLYTAIMVSEPRHGKPHPHGIRFAWRWFAAALNLGKDSFFQYFESEIWIYLFAEPNPDITATLLHEFLKLAGYKLSQCYGEQFWKLIRLLNSEYYAEINKVSRNKANFNPSKTKTNNEFFQITPDSLKGPVSRLKIFVEEALNRGRFPEPKGILSPNFW